MDYETGSATDAHDMLDKIRTFLVANGWSQNGYVSETYGYRLHLNKGALYINMFSGIATDPISDNTWYSTTYRMSGIAVSPSTGFTASPTGAKAWKNMPGAPVHDPAYFDYADDIFACAVADMTGAVVSYHLVADGDQFIAAMEISTGVYRWIAFGLLDAYGSIGSSPNGLYVCTSSCMGGSNSTGLGYEELRRIFAHIRSSDTSYPNATLRFNDAWAVPGGNPVGDVAQPISAIGYGYTPYQDTSITWGAMHGLLSSMPADIGGLSPLLPAQIGVVYSGNPVPIGHFGLTRITHMDGFSVGQSISVGSEDFVVLPCNNADFDYPYAIAIRVTGA